MNRSVGFAPLPLLVLLGCGLLATSCASDDSTKTPESPFTERATGRTVPFASACESSERPIVFVHGFLASGDTWGNHIRRFVNNGYCIDQLYAFDWNTLDLVSDDDPVDLLDAFIDEVLEQNDAERIDLVGHSRGGGLAYDYLDSPYRAGKVAHYAHVASIDRTGPAGPGDKPVPTLNLYSESDTILSKNDGIDGARNVRLTDEDHYEVATSDASFEAIYRFFHDDAEPETYDIGNEAPAWLYGKVLSLGLNEPQAGRTVAVFPVDATSGQRLSVAPLAVFDVTDQGYWGPFYARPEQRYELFVAAQGDDDLAIHYYIEPAVATSSSVYLRTLPAPDSLAGSLLSGLPKDSEAGTAIVFFVNGAIEAGVDDVTLEGTQLATAETASAANTTIALFLYDADQSGDSDFSLIGTFAAFPFLNGIDVYLEPEPEHSVTFTANGRSLATPVWSTVSDGVSIVVFE